MALHKFVGKAYWSKVYDPDEYLGVKKWKLDLVVDKKTLKTIQDLGVRKKPKDHEEGTLIQFTRPVSATDTKGVTRRFAAPKIYDKDGNVIVDYEVNEAKTDFVRKGEPLLIGNGSEVEITVDVYDTKKAGVGQRLESIKILDLIEYSGGDTGAFIVEDAKGPEVKAPW